MAKEPTIRATFAYQSGDAASVLEFLKRMRSELRTLRKVRVWPDRLLILDVNHDAFEVTGLGYRAADIVAVLANVNTAFNRDTIHAETDQPFKEFDAGKRYPWAADRVM